MFWSQIAGAAISLAFLLSLGYRSLPLALMPALLGNTVSQFANPARNAMITVIVERDQAGV